VLPQDLQPQVLDYMHDSPVCGHYGITRTCRRIASRFWWSDFRADVAKKIKKCLVCELSKPPRQGEMVVCHPTRRFEMVAIDVMEISPKSARGNSKTGRYWGYIL
jgi:hypothetical protein